MSVFYASPVLQCGMWTHGGSVGQMLNHFHHKPFSLLMNTAVEKETDTLSV